MSTTIVSTTDTPEQIQAALGPKADASVETPAIAEKPATTENVVEKTEASGALEKEESEVDDSTDESEGEEAPKKTSGFKKRIGKLSKQKAEAERLADYWRNEALKKPQTQADPVQTKAADNSNKPKSDEYTTHEEFVEALTDWKMAQRDAKAKQTEIKTRHEKQISTHQERVKEFVKAHDDFDDVISDVDDIPMSMTVQEVILAADNGPELMYELAKSRDEYKRICALPAIAAAREMGKFEAKLQSKSSSVESVEIKTKPKPISPINAKSAGNKNPEDMTFKEFEKWREQSLKKAQGFLK